MNGINRPNELPDYVQEFADELVGLMDENDPQYYAAWCERDGEWEELINRAKELGLIEVRKIKRTLH